MFPFYFPVRSNRGYPFLPRLRTLSRGVAVVATIAITFQSSRFDPSPWAPSAGGPAFEWPPSPWRILRAIAHVAEGAGTLSRSWPWIREFRAPPLYHLPQVSVGVRPHTTSGSPLGFIVIDPASPTLYVSWPDLTLKKSQVAHLEGLLSSISFLGRSPTRVAMGLVAEAPERPDLFLCGTTPAPGAFDEITLLCAGPDTDIAALHGHRSPSGLPPTAVLATYYRPLGAILGRLEEGESRQQGAWVQYDILGRMPLTLTNAVAEQARKAVMARYGRQHQGSVSAVFSGKDPVTGQPLSGHRHGYFLPTDDDGDGALDHLTVFSRSAFDPAELRALEDLRVLYPGPGLPRPIHLRWAPSPRRPELLKASRVWATHTPFVPMRHSKPDGRESVQEQILLELRRRGLPVPKSLTVKPLAPGPDFFLLRSAPRTKPLFSWAEIRFASSVEGPICLGAAAHYGMGLFTPKRAEARTGPRVLS